MVNFFLEGDVYGGILFSGGRLAYVGILNLLFLISKKFSRIF